MSYRLLAEAVEGFLSAEREAAHCDKSEVDHGEAMQTLQMAREHLQELLDLRRKMPVIKSILVAIDESEQALWAAEMAGNLAGELSAQVVLLHAYKMPIPMTPEAVWEEDRIEEGLCQLGNQLLDKAEQNIPKGTRVKKLIRRGYASDEILAVASNEKADLIVMGTHGRGWLAEVVLGSTAEAVIRRASCPVLTVAHPIHLHRQCLQDQTGVTAGISMR